MHLFITKRRDPKLQPIRRKLTIYVARAGHSFPSNILFVAYWHTDDPKRALINPFFYEHAARNDIEGNIVFWPVPEKEFEWCFQHEVRIDERIKSLMLDLSTRRGPALNSFFEKCWTAIEKNPKTAFQEIFR